MNEFELALELDRVSNLKTKAKLKRAISDNFYRANRSLHRHYSSDSYNTSAESLKSIKVSNMHYQIAQAAVAWYGEIFDDVNALPQYTHYTVPTVAIHLSLIECG